MAQEFYSIGSDGSLSVNDMLATMTVPQLESQCVALQGHTVYITQRPVAAPPTTPYTARIGVVSAQKQNNKWKIEHAVSLNPMAAACGCEQFAATILEDLPKDGTHYGSIISLPVLLLAMNVEKEKRLQAYERNTSAQQQQQQSVPAYASQSAPIMAQQQQQQVAQTMTVAHPGTTLDVASLVETIANVFEAREKKKTTAMVPVNVTHNLYNTAEWPRYLRCVDDVDLMIGRLQCQFGNNKGHAEEEAMRELRDAMLAAIQHGFGQYDLNVLHNKYVKYRTYKQVPHNQAPVVLKYLGESYTDEIAKAITNATTKAKAELPKRQEQTAAGKAKSTIKCYTCGFFGHKSTACPKNKSGAN